MSQHHTLRLSSWARLVGLSLLLGVGVLGSLGLSSRTAHAQPAATGTVNACDEATLRSAITNAASGDTLTFGCSGTIMLTSQLEISKDLTLDGSGQNVTLDGQNQVRVLVVNYASFTLNALTVAHGNSTFGGGFYINHGTVTISNSTFANNMASGDGGGGGLFNYDSTLNITNSTIANNSAQLGGGLYIDGGTVSISNSTIANNMASGDGGGLFNDFGTLNITNSTIANNSAPSRSGGLFNQGRPKLGRSIVANNSGGNCFGDATSSQGYNLESSSDCGFTSTGDLQNTNPKLASALASNGGPTQTLVLADGSPAINHIPSSACVVTTDQRGTSRPQGPACDIGALEFRVPKLSLPGTITRDASSPQGATVSYSVSASLPDDASATPSVSCSSASGSTFAIGTTTVTCSTNDAANPPDVTTGSFQVVVKDTDLALSNVPADITVKATTASGAVVTYTPPTVVDEDSPLPAVSCTPASGSTFPIGKTTVTCSASDDRPSTVRASFQVVVQDVTPPVLNLPSTITVNATSPQGASVTYTVTASDPDNAAADLTISCSPASGSTFPMGTTTVKCTASDPAGNSSSGSFQVVVKDMTAPTLSLPSTIMVDATSPQGAVVNYTVTASDSDNAASDLKISCSPASGSTFAIGTRTVNCSASDPAGNKATGSFQVVVKGAAAQVSDLVNLVNSFHLSSSLQTALDNKLKDVLTAINAGQTATACSELTDFIGFVQSHTGKGLTTAQANQLIAAAKQVQAVLGC